MLTNWRVFSGFCGWHFVRRNHFLLLLVCAKNRRDVHLYTQIENDTNQGKSSVNTSNSMSVCSMKTTSKSINGNEKTMWWKLEKRALSSFLANLSSDNKVVVAMGEEHRQRRKWRSKINRRDYGNKFHIIKSSRICSFVFASHFFLSSIFSCFVGFAKFQWAK